MCLKFAGMRLTFQVITIRNYLTKNFEKFFGGTPILAPRSALSPKMTTPKLPMTPLCLDLFDFVQLTQLCTYFVLVIKNINLFTDQDMIKVKTKGPPKKNY